MRRSPPGGAYSPGSDSSSRSKSWNARSKPRVEAYSSNRVRARRRSSWVFASRISILADTGPVRLSRVKLELLGEHDACRLPHLPVARIVLAAHRDAGPVPIGFEVVHGVEVVDRRVLGPPSAGQRDVRDAE